MGQRQNYDGPDWKRDALFAECNRRGLLAALKTDAELREALIAYDEEHLPNSAGEVRDRPEIVCLCGSTRFAAMFWDVGWELTLQGILVLTINVVRWVDDHAGEHLAPEVCDLLDELHFCKIDIADSIKVINVDGYIGESTSVGIAYAMYLNKPVNYLEN